MKRPTVGRVQEDPQIIRESTLFKRCLYENSQERVFIETAPGIAQDWLRRIPGVWSIIRPRDYRNRSWRFPGAFLRRASIMPVRFTVIQYIPDPIADERINIGVVGYAEGRVLFRFLRNWERVKAFGGEESISLDRVEALFRGVDEARLMELMDTWQWPSSIRFMSPGGSLRSLEEVVDEAAKRFLVESSIGVIP